MEWDTLNGFNRQDSIQLKMQGWVLWQVGEATTRDPQIPYWDAGHRPGSSPAAACYCILGHMDPACSVCILDVLSSGLLSGSAQAFVNILRMDSGWETVFPSLSLSPSQANENKILKCLPRSS